MSIYTCICGRSFDKPNSFNGHKSKCVIHLQKKGSLVEKLKQDVITNKKISSSISSLYANKRAADLEKWISEKHTCEKCKKIMTEKFGSGRFCSRSCANGRPQSETTKSLIKEKMNVNASARGKIRHEKAVTDYNLNPKKCRVCGNIIPYEKRTNNTCGSEACLKQLLHNAGVKSAIIQGDLRRSKNEMFFAELCSEYFLNVSTNAPLFNGWDADVIIHDYKIAVLWNGSWHFDKITMGHSVSQVQNRDKLKIKEIVSYGYTPYIIEDHGSFNENFVKEEFEKFLNFIDSKEG